MMNKERLNNLKNYIKAGVSPLLVANIPSSLFTNSVVLEASIDTKFIEILKYKKISTFELPENCLIIVTCSDLTNNKINEEIYSLVAQI